MKATRSEVSRTELTKVIQTLGDHVQQDMDHPKETQMGGRAAQVD